MNHSRRAFLEAAGLGAAVMAAGGSARAATHQGPPDLVVLNADVVALDDAAPHAQAFAVRGDRFLATGSTTEMRALAGPKTRIVDAQGGTVTPGFIDAHNHGGGETLLYGVMAGDPYEAVFVTVQSIVDKLAARAATLPPDTWVEALYYDDTKIEDRRPLTRTDLDRASTRHPIIVFDRGHHAAVFNSHALALAGVTRDTPDPPGGTLGRDANGELTGRATDRAMYLVFGGPRHPLEPGRVIGRYETFTPAEQTAREIAGLEFISRKFAQYGITSICLDQVLENVLGSLQIVRERGALHTRINYEPGAAQIEAMIKTGVRTGLGDEWLRIGGTAEYSIDGGLSSRSMSMIDPYPGSTPPYRGNLTVAQDDLDAWAERMIAAGIRPNCHANGAPAIERVLTAYERALEMQPGRDARPKITHCSLPTADQIGRIKALGATPALFNTYLYYNSDKFGFYGAALAEQMVPYRSLRDAGVPASTGSDFFAGPFPPLMGLRGIVTRKGFDGQTWGPSQRVGIDDAIRASTLNGAYGTFEETIKGSITPGKLADFVILGEDLHKVDPDAIKDVKIMQTVVGGVVRYEA